MWNFLLGLNIFRGYVGFSECITSRKGSFCQNHLSIPIENWGFLKPIKALEVCAKLAFEDYSYLPMFTKKGCRTTSTIFVAVEKSWGANFVVNNQVHQVPPQLWPSLPQPLRWPRPLRQYLGSGWCWGLISSCVGWGGVVISYQEKKG